jgi:hypothetical protein
LIGEPQERLALEIVEHLKVVAFLGAPRWTSELLQPAKLSSILGR